jgi:predicted DCC family thiol-disulfide oxidoreductase YuxK
MGAMLHPGQMVGLAVIVLTVTCQVPNCHALASVVVDLASASRRLDLCGSLGTLYRRRHHHRRRRKGQLLIQLWGNNASPESTTRSTERRPEDILEAQSTTEGLPPSTIPTMSTDSSLDDPLSSASLARLSSSDSTSVSSASRVEAIVKGLFKNGDDTARSSGCNKCGPIYVFDGICNFCNDSVHLCYDLDKNHVLRFCSMQSTTGRAILQYFGKSPDDRSSLVLVESAEVAHFQSDAVLNLIKHLSGVPPIVRTMAALFEVTLPESLRHAAYHLVADNRHVFGSSDGPTCRVDLDPSRFIDETEMDATETLCVE